jgi:hypothetical protein
LTWGSSISVSQEFSARQFCEFVRPFSSSAQEEKGSIALEVLELSCVPALQGDQLRAHHVIRLKAPAKAFRISRTCYLNVRFELIACTLDPAFVPAYDLVHTRRERVFFALSKRRVKKIIWRTMPDIGWTSAPARSPAFTLPCRWWRLPEQGEAVFQAWPRQSRHEFVPLLAVLAEPAKREGPSGYLDLWAGPQYIAATCCRPVKRGYPARL